MLNSRPELRLARLKWPRVLRSQWAGRADRNLHTQPKPEREIIFSGIQPTGIPHIGNWFGALKHWVGLQDGDAQLFFSVVDLHAITIPQAPNSLRRWRREALATFLAVGLKPERCTMFYQSDVPAHSELAWILGCMSPLGSLLRMTTWKSKVANAGDLGSLLSGDNGKARMGLLAYPILQAADILVHRASKVPVGADQTQHLEFARDCARSINIACDSQILREPVAMYTPIPRVMSLRNPSKKMSKSDPDPRSRILLTDSQEVIHAKVRASLTDSIDGLSFSPSERPGVANLLTLLSYLDPAGTPESGLVSSLAGHSLGAVKDLLATRIDSELAPIRDSFMTLMQDESGASRLTEVAQRGADAARQNAAKTMEGVHAALGI